MALNNNSLMYSSLDKLIEMTKKIQSPCETSLQWVSYTWDMIRRMPIFYRSYSYHLLSKATLNIQVAINAECAELSVFYYENDEVIFLCLEKQEFDSLLKNEAQKNHLMNGVRTLKIIQCSSEEAPHNAVPFRTFLSNCQSIKIISVQHETSNEFEPGTELLYYCFSVCPNIEIFNGFIVDDHILFCKYVFGIEYNDRLNINKILKTNKPTWPKLKKLCVSGFGDDYMCDILCFLILKDFENAYNQEEKNGVKITLKNILKYRKHIKCSIPMLRNRFDALKIQYCKYFFNAGLDTRKVLVSIRLGKRKLKYYLKTFKKLYSQVPENQVNFCLSNDYLNNYLTPNLYLEHFNLLKIKYPFVLKFTSIYNYVAIRHFPLGECIVLTALIPLLPNLQILNIRIFCQIYDFYQCQLPVCLAYIPCISITTTPHSFCPQYVEYFIQMFPNVKNLVLKFNCCDCKVFLPVDIKMEYKFIKDIKNLKSFRVKFDYDLVADWIDFLKFVSKYIDKNVELLFSVPESKILTDELSLLRNLGWHLYIE